MSKLYLNPSPDVRRLYAQIDLEESWHAKLKQHCEKKGILFFSSPTYLEAVDLMEELGVQLYKLASAQIGTFPQIVSKVARTGKPVILSTGLVTAGQVESSVRAFDEASNPNYVILHCNSIYPTPYDRVNLPMMDVYRRAYGCPVGYSDHTDDIYVALAAVSQGAAAIEKHFTLDLKFDTPDTIVALDPSGFARLTRGVRAVEAAAVGRQRIEIEPEEAAFKESLLYRLVLKVRKRTGEAFREEDFDYRRHGSGIDCRDAGLVLERFVAARDLDSGTLLAWKDVAAR
jgi:sialic acid synthase SpsE